MSRKRDTKSNLDSLLEAGAPKDRRFRIPIEHPELVPELEKFAVRYMDGTTKLTIPQLYRHWFRERSEMSIDTLRKYLNHLVEHMRGDGDYADEVRKRG